MPQYGPDETLDLHVRAEAAGRFQLDDVIDFEGLQYKVILYQPQSDGTVKVRITPTGHKGNYAPPLTH